MSNPERIEEQKEKASKTLATMLDYLGLDAKLKAEEKGAKIAIKISSEDAGRIIGRKGQTLDSLQLLLNRMMFNGDDTFPRIMLDIDGYFVRDAGPRDGRRNDRRGDERANRGGSRGDYGDRDRGDYRKREDGGGRSGSTEEELQQKALDASKEVKRWGEDVVLPPMNAHDRRIIHITLQEDAEIETSSLGDGARKKVLISLKK